MITRRTEKEALDSSFSRWMSQISDLHFYHAAVITWNHSRYDCGASIAHVPFVPVEQCFALPLPLPTSRFLLAYANPLRPRPCRSSLLLSFSTAMFFRKMSKTMRLFIYLFIFSSFHTVTVPVSKSLFEVHDSNCSECCNQTKERAVILQNWK